MSLATIASPRPTHRSRPVTLATLLRQHERRVDAVRRAVEKHGLVTWENGISKSDVYQHPAVNRASRAVDSSNKAIVRALLDLGDLESFPGWLEWYHGVGPVMRRRVGNRLVLVIPDSIPSNAQQGENEPEDETDLVNFCRVVVVNLD